MAIVDFDTGTWTDKWVRTLNPTAKNLFLYLWTNDHKNLIAMYEINFEQIAFELNLKLPQIMDNLKLLYPKVMVDYGKNIVWVVNHVRRQYLRTDKVSPKIIEGIRKCLILMKGHFFVGEFLKIYKSLNLFNSEKPYPYTIGGYAYPPGEGKGEGKGKGKKGEDSKEREKQKSEIEIPPELKPAMEILKTIPGFPVDTKDSINFLMARMGDNGDDLLTLLKKLKTAMQNLKALPGYPFDPKKDIEFLADKLRDYPEIDFVALLKNWKVWLMDYPFTERSNPRSQLNNQFEYCRKYNKCKVTKEKTSRDDDYAHLSSRVET